MKASERKVSPQAVQRLVVARLIVRTKRVLSRDQVVKSVAQAIRPPLTAAAAEAAARDALVHCERLGWVTRVPASKVVSRSKQRAKPRAQQPRLALTSKAQDLVTSWFGGQSMPVVKNWEHARQLVGLSMIGRAVTAHNVLRVDELAAVILAESQGVPASVTTLSAVVDYLAWRALGVESHAAFDVDAVQRHLLQKLVPADVRVGRTIWRRMLAMRAVGADGLDADALTHALFARRVKTKAAVEAPAKRARSRPASRKPPSSPANDNEPRRRRQPTLPDFAAAVREAARLPTVTRFHDDRAFIGSIWEHMRGRGLVGSMTLEEFKIRLIAAHRDGLLRITRADLVGAMDPHEVERSEARYQDATFHFVALEAGGGR